MYHATITILTLLLALCITPAFAANYEVKELNYGTREQFRACLDSEERIKAHSKMLAEYIIENNTIMVQIQTEAEALVNEQVKVLANDREQVDAFNKRIAEHNKLVFSANVRADKTRAEQEAYNKELVEHNKKCSSLVFRLADREAVLNERKAAGSSPESPKEQPKNPENKP